MCETLSLRCMTWSMFSAGIRCQRWLLLLLLLLLTLDANSEQMME
jgi:hypothetical protein